MTLPPLREIIARHGLGARRALGQHFLLDGNLAAQMVRAAGALDGRHVIEIGPGPGGLTRAILASAAASLVAIEIDSRAVNAVRELIAVWPGRLTVFEADALEVDLAALVPPPRQIIANLPYNVATPLLLRWLREATAFEQMTLMFQQEVAERICAQTGGPEFGRLSVIAQWICSTELVLRVPPEAFVPPPKVWSAVVRLTPHRTQPDTALFTSMERLTAAAFGQRRKMLRGALRPVGGATLLASAGIGPDRRAETLSVAEFDRLARLDAGSRSHPHSSGAST